MLLLRATGTSQLSIYKYKYAFHPRGRVSLYLSPVRWSNFYLTPSYLLYFPFITANNNHEQLPSALHEVLRTTCQTPNMSVIKTADSLADASTKPILVIQSIPTYGHNLPMLKICSHLSHRGYNDIFFIGGREHEAQIARAGAHFIEHPVWMSDDFKHQRAAIADPVARGVFEVIQVYIGTMAARHQLLKTTLETIRRAHGPRRKVVVLHECLSSMATVPFFYGAPLPEGYDEMPRVVNVPIYALFVTSADTGFFPLGEPPARTDEDRARNRARLAAHQQMQHYRDVMAALNRGLRALGCTREADEWVMDVMATTADVTLMVCSPSMEYPRSDLCPKVKYVGCLPNTSATAKFRASGEGLPEWWPEVQRWKEEEGKFVVMVTQGTLSTDYDDLVIPTIQALADRHEDVMVVAILGQRGATLEGLDFELPANAYVADYLPYELILPLADVSVQNGGYGGWSQAVMAGVPTVLAGNTEEKPETIMRGVWSGTSVGITERRPGVEKLRDAITKVLGDPSYRQRTAEIKKENEALDSLAQIESFLQ